MSRRASGDLHGFPAISREPLLMPITTEDVAVGAALSPCRYLPPGSLYANEGRPENTVI